MALPARPDVFVGEGLAGEPKREGRSRGSRGRHLFVERRPLYQTAVGYRFAAYSLEAFLSF